MHAVYCFVFIYLFFFNFLDNKSYVHKNGSFAVKPSTYYTRLHNQQFIHEKKMSYSIDFRHVVINMIIISRLTLSSQMTPIKHPLKNMLKI